MVNCPSDRTQCVVSSVVTSKQVFPDLLPSHNVTTSPVQRRFGPALAAVAVACNTLVESLSLFDVSVIVLMLIMALH